MSAENPSLEQVATRFAPSPSGDLHVGGARTALFCWAFARQHDGRFILRIEDTDQRRSSTASALGFLRDLIWLGLNWDEGPELDGGVCGDHGPYFQSERLAIYQERMQALLDADLAYHAFDTTEELDAKRRAAREAKQAYRYDRAGLDIPREERFARAEAGEAHVVRFRTPDRDVVIQDAVLGETTIPAGEIDDFIIRKADGFPTYHFAVVVDDALMNVSYVLRAQEHFNNTAKHLLLQDAMQFAHPNYAHFPLIINPDGSKMSKRDKDKAVRAAVKAAGLTSPPPNSIDDEVFNSWLADKKAQLGHEDLVVLAAALDVALPEINVQDFRRSGYLPQVLCNFLALNGWSPGNDLEKFDNAFLVEHFDLGRVQKAAARFDREKLLAFNLDAIQAMSKEEFASRVRAHGEVYHEAFLERLTDEQFTMLSDASHERSKTLDELYTVNSWLLLPDDEVTWPITKAVRKGMLKGDPCGVDLLEQVLPVLAELDDFSAGNLEETISQWAEAHCDGNLGKVAQPLRIAVTGGTVSPPIFSTLAILGQSSCLERAERCIAAMRVEVSKSVEN